MASFRAAYPLGIKSAVVSVVVAGYAGLAGLETICAVWATASVENEDSDVCPSDDDELELVDWLLVERLVDDEEFSANVEEEDDRLELDQLELDVPRLLLLERELLELEDWLDVDVSEAAVEEEEEEDCEELLLDELELLELELEDWLDADVKDATVELLDDDD